MNVLVLIPHQRVLQYAYYRNGRREPVLSASTNAYGIARADGEWLASLLRKISETCGIGVTDELVIVIRGNFGGAAFAHPTRVTEDVVRQLRELAPQAPLHVPPLVEMINACGEVFIGEPVVLVFETAFFASLPPREHSYGLDPDLMKKLHMRRYGYHGILHEAACLHLNRAHGDDGTDAATHRILSVCLEPKPEIAAVIGHRPVMVTSGATPLEGLPGQTSCGELDPSIVLAMAEVKKWGPEQVNDVLTRQSGLLGLAGKPVTLAQVFSSDDPEMKKVADFMRYRILLAAGAAAATMGGVDAIVFSGRYADLGTTLGPWLAQKLTFKGNPQKRAIAWEVFSESLTRTLADVALATANRADVAVMA